MKLLENKKFLLIGGIILILIIVGGGVGYILSTHKSTPTQQITQEQQQVVPTLSPDSIGLSLTPVDSKGGKAINMEIANVSDITSIDYEVDYSVTGNIPRGVIGHIDVKSGNNSVKQQVFLGTCSDVCHPDNVITDVKFTLKVTKTDGTVYQVVKSVSL